MQDNIHYQSPTNNRLTIQTAGQNDFTENFKREIQKNENVVHMAEYSPSKPSGPKCKIGPKGKIQKNVSNQHSF